MQNSTQEQSTEAMTNPIDERRARALKANIGKQWAATPAPKYPPDPDDWTAEGDVLDLVECAEAIRLSDEAAHVGTYDTREQVVVTKEVWRAAEAALNGAGEKIASALTLPEGVGTYDTRTHAVVERKHFDQIIYDVSASMGVSHPLSRTLMNLRDAALDGGKEEG